MLGEQKTSQDTSKNNSFSVVDENYTKYFLTKKIIDEFDQEDDDDDFGSVDGI